MTDAHGMKVFQQKLVAALKNFWMKEFDVADPVMSAYGVEAWDAQCILAAEALDKEIHEVIVGVTERLFVDGEFYRGPGV